MRRLWRLLFYREYRVWMGCGFGEDHFSITVRAKSEDAAKGEVQLWLDTQKLAGHFTRSEIMLVEKV